MTDTRSTNRRSTSCILPTIIALLLVLVGNLFVPWPLGGYAARPQPVGGYAQAVDSAQSLDSARAAEMNPLCKTELLTHGSKTARAIVLVHGYTTCPQQFHAFGAQLYDQGLNVLIAALPYHGLANRMTDDLSQLTASDLAAYGDRVLDIAHGLGDEVDMLGLSAGGVVTAWGAQNRSDLSLAVVISPAFGFKQIPTQLTRPAMNALAVLPESYSWWDPALQLQTKPDYAYPRYSLHALMQIVRLGAAVETAAARRTPAAARIIVVTNGAEPSVNNELTAEVVQSWKSHAAKLDTYTFDAALKLPHDLIDPNQPDQQVGLVYPVLLNLVVGDPPAGVGASNTRR